MSSQGTRCYDKEIKSNGVVPIKNAVAILVVPPINRDPKTKQRPEPHYSSLPIKEGVTPARQGSQPFAPSIMYPIQDGEEWKNAD